MRKTVWVLYRVILAACLAVGSLLAVGKPTGDASAAHASTWYWQNPLPRDYSLSGFACRSLHACLAVGQGGVVVTTEDGGQHWTERVHNCGIGALCGFGHAHLWSVRCPGRATCYAAGFVPGPASRDAHAVIVRSVDGGKTWSRSSPRFPISPRQSLSSLVCPAVQTCLAVVSPGTQILRTVNGGKTWRTFRVSGSGNFDVLQCATTIICYAMNDVAHMVARSVDGGMTWHWRARVPTGGLEVLEGMACPRANTCVITSAYCCEEGIWGDIFVSRDGARSWKHVLHLAGNSAYMVTCPQATTCYAGTDSPLVISTTNGGRNWSSHRLPESATGTVCPSSATCYAFGSFSVITTRDGFRHTRETLAHSMLPGLYLGAISCPTTTSCYAVGDRQQGAAPQGGVAVTNDSGKTWHEYSASPPQMSHFRCPTATVCYGVDPRGLLYRSGDGARSWKPLPFPATAAGFSDVICVSATTCYATSVLHGPGAGLLAVLVTHNGGTSWQAKTTIDAAARAGSSKSNTTVRLGRIACPHTLSCFVTATTVRTGATPADRSTERVSVLSTRDGGETWIGHTPTSPWSIVNEGDPTPLSCPTVVTCYLVQYNDYNSPEKSPAVVLVTHDGGVTWRRTAAGLGTVLEDIACPTAQTCRAVGTTGIVATSDGGVTWQQQRLGDGAEIPRLSGIACPSVDLCYAVGGTIIVGTRAD